MYPYILNNINKESYFLSINKISVLCDKKYLNHIFIIFNKNKHETNESIKLIY